MDDALILKALESGESGCAVAKRLGISKQTVSEIRNHKHWTTLPEYAL